MRSYQNIFENKREASTQLKKFLKKLLNLLFPETLNSWFEELHQIEELCFPRVKADRGLARHLNSIRSV